MTRMWIVILGICLLAAEALAAEPPALKTPKEKVSYAVGADVAANFKRMELDLDVDLLVKGLKDGFAGQGLLLSDKELQEVLAAVQNEVRAKQVRWRGSRRSTIRRKGTPFWPRTRRRKA
jgi:hypothetical protein